MHDIKGICECPSCNRRIEVEFRAKDNRILMGTNRFCDEYREITLTDILWVNKELADKIESQQRYIEKLETAQWGPKLG